MIKDKIIMGLSVVAITYFFLLLLAGLPCLAHSYSDYSESDIYWDLGLTAIGLNETDIAIEYLNKSNTILEREHNSCKVFGWLSKPFEYW